MARHALELVARRELLEVGVRDAEQLIERQTLREATEQLAIVRADHLTEHAIDFGGPLGRREHRQGVVATLARIVVSGECRCELGGALICILDRRRELGHAIGVELDPRARFGGEIASGIGLRDPLGACASDVGVVLAVPRGKCDPIERRQWPR